MNCVSNAKEQSTQYRPELYLLRMGKKLYLLPTLIILVTQNTWYIAMYYTLYEHISSCGALVVNILVCTQIYFVWGVEFTRKLLMKWIVICVSISANACNMDALTWTVWCADKNKLICFANRHHTHTHAHISI